MDNRDKKLKYDGRTPSRPMPRSGRRPYRSQKSSGYDKRAMAEARFEKNARLLKGYRKAMQKEGYDAGKGASRKRVRDDKDKWDQERDKSTAEITEKRGEGYVKKQLQMDERKRKKPKKSDPFRKARAIADSRRTEKEEECRRRENGQAEAARKRVERSKTTKKLRQRTRKGQPVMRNIVENLLHKVKQRTKADQN
eukprot:CAMPEP_0113316464 /NCGR_PEP_ID=MMETSP0010_2-20120614/11732_1 /TAXON_ID=216773 ORGANISM="Corethron hystrix, Strain 308" /NCGR_SAMPLE_ID=MMETSP0010_2 /ASSEMBLY_ACC=CAM_ASM_000155 /LENGTH=195 /DNA_ID=CAMNT_0000173191 /DNA_START=63 /DNA_END=650 /DNA_ORIENTATION=- /assembly_acc=CAM_ASM_000155